MYVGLVAVFMGPYTLCCFFTGHLIDHWGTRIILPLFLGTMPLATCLPELADNFGAIGLCRLVLGAAEAGIVPAVMVTIVMGFPSVTLRGGHPLVELSFTPHAEAVPGAGG